MGQIIPQSFYLMRHAQTTDNADGIISGGDRNPDINDVGRQEASAAHAIYDLLDPPPQSIVVSGLKRTTQTAELATDVSPSEYIVEPDINERDLGDPEGTITVAQQKAGVTSPNEESVPDHAARVVRGVNAHLGDPIKNPPLFVMHGGSIRRVFEDMGLPPGLDVPNAQICQAIPFNGTWKVFALSVENSQLKKQEISAQTVVGMAL